MEFDWSGDAYKLQYNEEMISKLKNLIIADVTHRFSEPEKMAEWLHNNYEEIALNNGWKTQDDCQVPFLELPKENKETMIELCDRFINGG
ncbi:hypothetical protein [Thalassobellus suaedae]|uniref:Uncharacterized protein n=1 Tax=Thalassobellus suaedae TaxID=3074124 RepID=A0ABY9XVP7_9FLAO|nr:hypothetical protein RHP51_04870 [Flavobacteriaceae bacterium HL-DH14]